MAVHLIRSDCEGFVCAVQWMGLMVICCGMDGDVRGECEGDEGTDCEDGDSDTEW